MSDMVLPGVYIDVRAEGLIVPGRVSVGNIGMVGTAEKGNDNEVVLLGSYDDAKQAFGEYDIEGQQTLTLVRALELAYMHGAHTVFAVKAKDYKEGLNKLLNENVHIVVAAGQDVSTIGAALSAHCDLASGESYNKERIAVVGSKEGSLNVVKDHKVDSDRVVVVTPGVKITESKVDNTKTPAVLATASATLPAAYAAAAVAGMLSARPPHVSLTNKVLSVEGLKTKFSAPQLKELIEARCLAIEERNGFRIVRGITTSTNTAWKQITTRRIVDYAKYGVRSAASSYIGLLNNERVRAALKSTLNSFLSEMLEDEMLTKYELDVTATRQDEIKGIVKVTMVLQPTFSIDFIKVTMFLG